MKTFIVAVTLFVAINARPDVSHLPTGSYLPAGGNVNFGSSQFGTSGFGVGGSSGIGGIGGFQSQSHGGSHGGVGGFGTGFQGGFSGVGSGFHGGVGGIGGGFAQDQKHVYFYAAPEEHSLSRLRINIVPNSQRNTKIIFVKAPTYGSVTPEVIAPQSLSEDKTLVYVLVKRPEHGGQINIPTGVGLKPSKPEVYFIKYKTQQDAQHQISGGLQGQQVGSNVPDIGSASNFVSTLESGSSSGSHGAGSFISGGSHGSSGISSIGTHSSGSHGSNVFTSGSSGSSFGPAGASGPY